MSVFHLLSFVHPAIGLGLAVIATVILMRRRGAELSARRMLVAVAGLVALAAVLVVRAWTFQPWFLPSNLDWEPIAMVGYLLPLAAGTLFVAVLGWPVRGREAGGRATLERRGILTFTRRWWLVGIAAVLVIAAALAIAAGLASSPDASGDYTQYAVETGTETWASTSIYGWYFSVPSAIGTVLLLVVFAAALRVVSRSPLRVDPALDDGIRRHRARDVTAAAAGALTLHLGAVLASLGGTAALTMAFSTNAGMVTIVTPFSAVGPALGVAGQVATVIGFALWWFVVVAAISARRVPA